MNKYKKLGKDFSLLFLGNFTSKILVFLMVPFYTSCLSTEQYGIADLITTTVTLLCPILTLTINEAVMRFALDKECDNKQVFSVGIYITLFSIMVMLIILPLAFKSKSLKPYVGLLFLYYIAVVINFLLNQFAKGINKVKEYALSGIIQTIVNVGFNIVLLLIFKCGVEGYLWANIIGLLSGSAYLFIKLRLLQFIINLREIDKTLIIDMVKYAIPLIPDSLSWWIANSSDKYILNVFVGAASVGLYSVAYKIPSILTTITALFAMAMRISAVEGFGSSENAKFINKTYRIYAAFLSILTAIIIASSEVLGKILFQKEFFIAWKISVILLVGFMFFSLAEYLGVIYLSSKHTKQVLITTILGACINILLNIFLIPRWKNYGAALATAISYFMIWLLRIMGCQKYIKIDINSRWYIINTSLLIAEVFFVLNKTIFGIFVTVSVVIVLNIKPILKMLSIRRVKDV